MSCVSVFIVNYNGAQFIKPCLDSLLLSECAFDLDIIVIDNSLDELNLFQIKLSSKEINEFYYGMSNKCIWPLFHYFIEFSKFDNASWNSYVKINKKFSESIIEKVDYGGTVWVHDYQLLLLPKMIKR